MRWGVGGGVDMYKMKKAELIKIAEENEIPVNKKLPKIEIIKIIEKGLIDKQRKEIHEDLLDQLERNGVYGQHYIDLVSDYMALWDVKNKLIQDIEIKGVSVCVRLSLRMSIKHYPLILPRQKLR